MSRIGVYHVQKPLSRTQTEKKIRRVAFPRLEELIRLIIEIFESRSGLREGVTKETRRGCDVRSLWVPTYPSSTMGAEATSPSKGCASPFKVRMRIRQMLPTIDLSKTQKEVYSMVEADIGKPLGPEGKTAIKEEIEMFLLDQASQPQEGCTGETSGLDPRQYQKGLVAGKRANGTTAETNTEKKRRASTSAPTTATEGQHQEPQEVRMSDILPGNFQISNKRFVGVLRFNGKLLINIREYYDKNGQLAPGNKGISLTISQFEELGRKAKRVDASLEQEPFVETQFKLSDNRFVTVREYQGKRLVDIREYYQKEMEMLPGKKGISLASEQWVMLKAAIPALMAQLAEEGGTGAGAGRSVSARQTSGSRDPVTTPATTATNIAPPNAATKHVAISANGGHMVDAIRVSDSKIRIGDSPKFVSLENWKGQDQIDLRVHYQADGNWKPGNKGISLSTGQVEVILGSLDAITTALNDQDVSYSLDLAGKRRVTITEFSGNFMVNVREYYEKDGQLLPSKKGIAFNARDWPACRNAITHLSARMTFS